MSFKGIHQSFLCPASSVHIFDFQENRDNYKSTNIANSHQIIAWQRTSITFCYPCQNRWHKQKQNFDERTSKQHNEFPCISDSARKLCGRVPDNAQITCICHANKSICSANKNKHNINIKVNPAKNLQSFQTYL